MANSELVSGGLSRREFLGNAGALIVSFAMPLPGWAEEGQSIWPAMLAPESLDSWLALMPDGRVVTSVGKIEAGMGISTCFAQIVADELDVPMENVIIRMGDTATTVNQRGTGSSNGIIQGGAVLRKAGAEARRTLFAMAAERLGVPPDQLTVKDGVVSVTNQPQRSVTYGELIGDRRFELKLNDKAKTKPASEYKFVGKPIPRIDIPAKVTGEYAYLVDFKLPGMLHGRVMRPPEAGAKLLAVVHGQKLPGLVKVVTRGDFIAVVCGREEEAVRAARQLKVRWSKPAPMFAASYDELYRSLRTAAPKVSKVDQNVGDVDAALSTTARVLEAQYDYPFQSHASMGPGCGVADVKDGAATVWMGGQKPYPLRKAVATLLGLRQENVRVIWLPGPGSYGMNDADDAAMDAVFLSQAVGRPVRVQYMRADATAWDAKCPPSTIHMRGGLDAQGQAIAFHYESRGYSARIRPSGTEDPGDTLSGQLFGGLTTKSTDVFPLSSESYEFTNKRKVAHVVAWEKSLITGLRTSHLRDPNGMATCFASECFIDELAASAGADPVEFRLRHLTDKRDKEAVRAVAQLAGWQPRPSPQRDQAGPVLRGRGIAYAPRAGTVVAMVAEVEVNRNTGRCRVTRFVVAHDCGFVINPLGLQGTIEANLIQAMSRAMHEAVQFTPTRVTSADWLTYPIADMTDVPDAIDIVLLNNRPDAKSLGAGEPTTRPVAAVIGNAIFDATGVRIRRVPFTAQSLQAAFRAQSPRA